MGLWQLYWCVSRGSSSTFVHHHLWCWCPQSPSNTLTGQQHLQLYPQFWSFSRDLTVLDLKTWLQQWRQFTSAGFCLPGMYLTWGADDSLRVVTFPIVWWPVRAKQHSSSFSALGGGHEPLASRGQPVPPQSVGLRARQAGQLPAVTL